jgi:endoglycosylceramidase
VLQSRTGISGIQTRALAAAVSVTALLCCVLAPSAAAAPSEPLGHAGRWITDANGRVVILHGWNMVYKVGSYRPEDSGFGDDDARFLADNGFNTVRLGVIYKGLEPTPGVYDDAYLESIARTESILADHGIFSLLDFHQDMYNERFQGEGFPDWAVVGDAATLPAEPRVGFPGNYLEMPALNRAYDHFWLNDQAADGRALQDAYAAAWRHVAGRFGDNPHVLGYNLFNEPWPGSQYPSCTSTVGCPVFDQQFLEPFSERVIAAIRQADPNTLAWYEPLLTFDFGADTSHGDTGDAHAGFAFNMYCLAELGDAAADLGPATGPECDTGYDLTLDNAEQQSLETGDALLMTEFAATNDLEIIRRVVELADERMISWQQWHYCGCDDPTTSGPGIQALVGDAAQPPTGANVNAEKLGVSSRPYPQAVAGTPQSYGFNSDTKEFQLNYSTARADGSGNFPADSRTEIFVPELHYPSGYAVEVEGAQVVSAPGAAILTLATCPGAGLVTVRVTTSGPPSKSCFGYARPRSATPLNIRLVPAFEECISDNASHGAPLTVPSCSPPVPASDYLTVGTPDANGKAPASMGVLTLKEQGESPINPNNGDQADVEISASFTDVRNQGTLTDYTGELGFVATLRITDRFNAVTGEPIQDDPATAADVMLPFSVPCSATEGSEGATCNVTTTADAVTGGNVANEGKRAVWQLDEVQVFDGGADGDADTTGDDTLFAVQGLFTP